MTFVPNFYYEENMAKKKKKKFIKYIKTVRFIKTALENVANIYNFMYWPKICNPLIILFKHTDFIESRCHSENAKKFTLNASALIIRSSYANTIIMLEEKRRFRTCHVSYLQERQTFEIKRPYYKEYSNLKFWFGSLAAANRTMESSDHKCTKSTS